MNIFIIIMLIATISLAVYAVLLINKNGSKSQKDKELIQEKTEIRNQERTQYKNQINELNAKLDTARRNYSILQEKFELFKKKMDIKQ